MAEFTSLGSHCEVSSCNQLDFLPFVCISCSKTFCKDHKSRDSHNCPLSQNQVAPEVDQKPTASNGGESKKLHHDCSFQGCSSRELLPVVCEHCHLNFCMSHRHQSDHKCSNLIEAPVRIDPVERVKEITGKDYSKVKKARIGVKNDSRAAKVALMKLKMKAEGDKSIPQEERVYFNIYLPKGQASKEAPVFFSKLWTVGKAVDKTAAIVGLKNENNIASRKKLRLFHLQTGEMLEMASCLQELLSSHDMGLFSGGTLILEYVDDNCRKLDNL